MSMVDPLYEWLLESGMLDSAESLFSIGPGDGRLELRLAKNFGLTVGYAEPTVAFRDSLEASADAAGLTNRIVERQEGPYKPRRLTRRYDLILSSGSWYAAGYDRSTLDQTLSALTPNGVLIIALSSCDDFFMTERITRPTVMTAEDLAHWLGNQGVEHELHRVERRVSNDLLLESGQLTELARDVLSFYTLRHWYKVPSRDKDRLKASLFRNKERGFFTRVQGLVVLYKSRQTSVVHD
jgi:SAM-dependent methyltransferase